jgi:hypothetical protein
MKRLVTAIILGLAFIPGLALASNFTTESIDVDNWSVGTYYKGYTWIFYVFEPSEPHIDYAWFQLEDNGSIKQKGNKAYHGSGGGQNTNAQPACCVFGDKIYLFWRDYVDYDIYYDAFDGSDWSGKKKLTSLSYRSTFGMAAAVMGDKLYLFYQGADHIEYTYTSDGENWSESKVIELYSKTFITGGNISATTFFQKYGDGTQDERILIAWPIDSKTHIETIECHLFENRVSFLGYSSLSKYAEGVALISGTVSGGGTGKNTVQIFALGKKDSWTGKLPFMLCEYRNDEHGTTISSWETITHITSGSYDDPHLHIPSAVTNYKVFGNNAHNLRQEVWMLYPGNVVRWNSDQYVRVQDTAQHLYDETYKKYWTMIGVVEGPPPYALNGRDPTSDDVSGYSSLSYAVQTDTAVSTSTSTDDEFFVSAGGPGEFWPGAGVSLTVGLEHHFCKTQTHSTTLSHNFTPTIDTSRFWTYRYYLRPTLRRLKYEIRDWKGNSLGRNAYIFSISDYNLHVDAIDMRDSLSYDPRLWDPATYQDRHIAANTSHYHIKAGRNINWVIGSEVELQISDATQLESSQSFSMTIKVEVGMEGVFDIGASGSITTEHSVSTDSINTVTVMANSPQPPPEYSGQYIKEFSFYPYWLEPKDSTPYWIPAEFKHQRPWCITYEVSEIGYDEAASSGLAEEERPPALKLYAVTLNPAGSDATIRYALPQASRVSLKVYDVNGRVIKTLENKEQTAGVHSVSWNGADDAGRSLSAGVYFCRLETDDEHRIGRIVVVK